MSFFLHRLMQKQYAGYPDLLQHREFDPEVFFARWADRIRAAGSTISFRNGLVEPLVELRQAVPDNHLIVRGANAILTRDERLVFHEYQAMLPGAGMRPDQRAIEGVAGARPATFRCAPMLRADGTVGSILTVSAAGAATELTLRCGEGNITLRRRPSTPVAPDRPPDVPAYEWTTLADTTLITLRSFVNSSVVREQCRQFAAGFAEHASRPRILFDLRDNNGGSRQFMHQWIAKVHCGPWRSYPRLEVAGALWPCCRWNWLVERQISDGSVDTEEAEAERERERAAWSSQSPPPTSRLCLDDQGGRAASPYAGRVFILVNRNSGSSGELAALLLKRAMRAVIVGERSAGTAQYSEVRRFVLPKTGLVCQLGTRRLYFDEEVESIGLPVDCYLERIDQEAAALVPWLDRLQEHVAADPASGIAPQSFAASFRR